MEQSISPDQRHLLRSRLGRVELPIHTISLLTTMTTTKSLVPVPGVVMVVMEMDDVARRRGEEDAPYEERYLLEQTCLSLLRTPTRCIDKVERFLLLWLLLLLLLLIRRRMIMMIRMILRRLRLRCRSSRNSSRRNGFFVEMHDLERGLVVA